MSFSPAYGDAPASPTASTERSVKSCYAVVYHLSPDRKWIVSGEGGWSEVHLCCDSMDMTHRLLAWTVKNQTVLLNANVTADCTYKEKSKNFHSFQDENGQRFGLGFHKSESGLRQAEHFVSAVVHVINECKEKLAEIEAFSLGASMVASSPPPLPRPASKSPRTSIHPSGPPPLPPGAAAASSSSSSAKSSSVAHSAHTSPPKMFSAAHSTVSPKASSPPAKKLPPVPISPGRKPTTGPPKPPPAPGSSARPASPTRPGAPPPVPAAALTSASGSTSPGTVRPKPTGTVRKSMGGLPKFSAAAEVATVSSSHASGGGFSSGMATSSSYGDLSPEEELALIPMEHETRGYVREAPKGVPKLGVLKIHAAKQGKMGGKHDSKISDVKSVERKLMVVYDKDSGTFEGLPAEWKKVLAKQFGVPARLLPGTKVPSYPAKIPTVLITLKKALKDAGGYQQTGIFRLAPSAEVNDTVKAAINEGRFDFSGSDVNVYANLIKVWFRDLPKALLACANPDQVESAATEADVVKCIADFPEPNKSIFLWLCDMCVEVAAFESTNKMGPKNLAIVIGPNLFDASVFDNPMRAMTYSGKVVDFFEKAIVWRRGSD